MVEEAQGHKHICSDILVLCIVGLGLKVKYYIYVYIHYRILIVT